MSAPIMKLKNSANCIWKGKLRTWFELTFIAEKYGWKPAGTKEPTYYRGTVPWDGQFRFPDGQTVLADDAHALAETLREVLFRTTTLIRSDMVSEIRKLIKFCEKGEFEIWDYFSELDACDQRNSAKYLKTRQSVSRRATFPTQAARSLEIVKHPRRGNAVLDVSAVRQGVQKGPKRP